MLLEIEKYFPKNLCILKGEYFLSDLKFFCPELYYANVFLYG